MSRFPPLLFAVAALSLTALGQFGSVDFEVQGPPCTVGVFPAGPGPGDAEGVSHNGNGFAVVEDSDNGLGFPTQGGQYLRLQADGPENHSAGTAPSSFGSGLQTSVFVAVPPGSDQVRLDWDFYCEEGPPDPTFFDGMMIDFINAAGAQLGVVAFADGSMSAYSSATDAGVCGVSTTAALDPAGPNHARAAVPTGATHLRISVWNVDDNAVPSHGVVDDICFGDITDFELSGPTCSASTFPTGLGVAGDPEGVSRNGAPSAATVDDMATSAGFPTSGAQFLRVRGSGQFDQVDGFAPGALPAAVNQVYIPVPIPGLAVSLDWDFYDAEGNSALFNDGAMIDVIDANGDQLAVLAFAESLSPDGVLLDDAGCGGFDSELAATVGPEHVDRRALPAGAAFIRCSQWNHGDTSFASMLAVDDVFFCPPHSNPFPGTGDDIELVTRVEFSPRAGFRHAVSPGDFFGWKAYTPGGTYIFEDVIFLGQVAPCGVPIVPAFPGLNVDLGLPGIFVISTTGLGFPLILGPGGATVDFGPAMGLGGFCARVQSIVPTAVSLNGIFAASDSHEVKF